MLPMNQTALSHIEKLEELYYQRLFRFANRLCGSPARAMALTQRTFRQAFDYTTTLPVPSDSQSWLVSILFSKFLEDRAHHQHA